MTTLALDTSLDACSVALVQGQAVLGSASVVMLRGHQERLAPMAAEVMAASGTGFASVDRVVATLGPGSFTGVRVGLAFAKGLALALGVPCIGVGTLQAAVLGAAGAATAVIDARQGLLYVQSFRDAAPLSPPATLTLAEAALAAAGSATLVGPAASLLAPLVPAARVVAWTGLDVVALARFGAGLPPAPLMPGPIYLRAPDTRTLAERGAAPAWLNQPCFGQA